MNNDVDQHKEAFLNEANQHVKNINGALLIFEKNQDKKSLHEVFRAFHTLKSMSAAMEFNDLAKLCHALEDLLDAIRNQKIKAELCIDDIFRSVDFLSVSLKAIEENKDLPIATAFIDRIEKILTQDDISFPSDSEKSLELEVATTEIKKVQSIDVKVDRLDSLLNLVEELLVNKMKLDVIQDSILDPELKITNEVLGRIINELQYNVMKIRMVSIDFIFNQFPRMVRDLAKKQHKEINLVINGGNIELDRSIVDEISESIIHIVRNAIDHGLETPEKRISEHKPAMGEIRLNASRSKETVIIEISDDGEGLDIEAIKKKAKSLGKPLLDSQDDLLNLVFSGISTKDEVTDISGRGLGLNIVKRKIESIGGSIQVKSELHQGTTFILEIPLSLAVVNTLFVRVSGAIFAIPVMSVERLWMAYESEIKNMLNYEAIILDNENIPLIRLQTLFGGKNTFAPKQPIVIIERAGKKVGLVVDELLTTEEIVIKPLNRYIKDNRFFSGSAIIGSGEIVLVLDIAHLFLLKKYEMIERDVA